jgi:outer membrane murein-binding lipoprotein Lpp
MSDAVALSQILVAGPMSKDGRFEIKINKAVSTSKELLAIRAQLNVLIEQYREREKQLALTMLSQAEWTLKQRLRDESAFVARALNANRLSGDGRLTEDAARKIYATQQTEAARIGATVQSAQERVLHWRSEVDATTKEPGDE